MAGLWIDVCSRADWRDDLEGDVLVQLRWLFVIGHRIESLFAESELAMPVIRISQQTWDRLKTYATPLEDTADDVVNIALDALEAARRTGLRIARHPTAAPLPKRNSERPKRGKRAPLKKFRAPLLETLYRLGGKAYSREIRKRIELLVAPMLGKADYELVSNAQPRWWNAICSVRNDLIRQGLFRNDSERGIWELSKRGFELMRAQAEDRRREGQLTKAGSRENKVESRVPIRLPNDRVHSTTSNDCGSHRSVSHL